MKNKFLLFISLLTLLVTPAFAKDTVSITFFYTPTCPKCQKISVFLKNLKQKYPQIEIEKYNMTGNIENLSKLRKYYQKFHIPLKDWAGTLALFSNTRYYYGPADIYKNLEPDIKSILKSTDLNNKADTKLNNQIVKNKADTQIIIKKPKTDNTIENIFKKSSITAIASAGLIDGINPCAFVTIIFFISYLTLINKSRKTILLTGLFFCFGVFIAYFAIGIGLFKLLYNLSAFPIISKIVYKSIGIFCLILAFISLIDAYNIRTKINKNVKLKLSDKFVKWIHNIIRYQVNSKYIITFAFVSGICISVIELVCTGQIYFPVIMYIIKYSSFRLYAVFYLFIYVFMFILPLIIVFMLVYAGISSEKIKTFTENHLYLTKILMFLIFLILSLLIIF